MRRPIECGGVTFVSIAVAFGMIPEFLCQSLEAYSLANSRFHCLVSSIADSGNRKTSGLRYACKSANQVLSERR